MDELKRLTWLCRRKNHARGKKQDPVTRGDSHNPCFSNFSLFLKLNNSLSLEAVYELCVPLREMFLVDLK